MQEVKLGFLAGVRLSLCLLDLVLLLGPESVYASVRSNLRLACCLLEHGPGGGPAPVWCWLSDG